MYAHGVMNGVVLGGGTGDSGVSSFGFKRPRKLGVSTRRPDHDASHVGGANAVEIDDQDGILYTAGRDGTIRGWDVERQPSLPPRCVAVLEGHAGWVNDLKAPRQSPGTLLSASSDRTVKAWRIGGDSDAHGAEGEPSQPRCVATMERHDDYVMALATPSRAGGREHFASGGLGADNVYLWDANVATNPIGVLKACGGDVASPSIARPLDGSKASVYALAMDGVGAVVAAGSTDAIVRVWDARDPSGCAKPAFKLKGHSDNVRSIAIDPSGRMCLTASSDRTLRLWDLGQRRCVQSLPGVHACAAWAARPADDSWHRAYSGGSDGRVYVTDLAHRRSSLLFQEKHGVLDLRVDARSGGKHVWTATMGTEVNKYRVDVTSGEHDAFGVAGSIGSNGSIGGRRRQSGGLIDRMSIDGGSHSHSHHHHGESGASMSMGGGSSPHGALWFSAGRSPRKSGGANPFASPSSSPFAASSAASARAAASHALPSVTIRGAAPIVQHAQLNDRVRVLAKDANGEVTLWDVTKCALVRTFAPGSVFEDVLAAINPIVAIPSWFTVDSRSGSLAITLSPSGAFAAEAYAQEMGVPGAIAETKINVGVQTIHALLRDWAARRAARADDENDTRTAFYGYSAAHASDDHDPSKLDPCDDAGAFATPDPPPVLLCEHHGGASWVRVPVEGLRGGDDEEALMPEWIVDCASGRHPVPESAKASFFVNPDPDVETPLPCIQNARVTAPRVLQSRKVSAYVLQKLRVEAPGGARPEDCLSLTCNGAECDPNMSMATIAKFMWKRGDEVQLLYSWREGVPMPDGLGGDGLASG